MYPLILNFFRLFNEILPTNPHHCHPRYQARLWSSLFGGFRGIVGCSKQTDPNHCHLGTRPSANSLIVVVLRRFSWAIGCWTRFCRYLIITGQNLIRPVSSVIPGLSSKLWIVLRIVPAKNGWTNYWNDKIKYVKGGVTLGNPLWSLSHNEIAIV